MTHLATSKAILSLARFLHTQESRVVKSSRLPVKIAAYLVSIGRLLCLAFLYRWSFFTEKIPGLAAYFDNSAVYFKTF